MYLYPVINIGNTFPRQLDMRTGVDLQAVVEIGDVNSTNRISDHDRRFSRAMKIPDPKKAPGSRKKTDGITGPDPGSIDTTVDITFGSRYLKFAGTCLA
jgi:hypothetical protein